MASSYWIRHKTNRLIFLSAEKTIILNWNKGRQLFKRRKMPICIFLDGYNKVWHYAGTNGKILYSNIPPGNYSFKVKWSNGEGLWTDELAMLTLEVKQYFWLTIYAYLLYGILLSVIAIVIYRYRKNKLEIKHQLKAEHLLREKEEEIHQDRLGFFTNIAHELQTPLTLIMGSVERYMEKPTVSKEQKDKPYFLSLIHQQAARLTYLVHQLLEFRKAEEGFYKNEYSQLNISELLSKSWGAVCAAERTQQNGLPTQN